MKVNINQRSDYFILSRNFFLKTTFFLKQPAIRIDTINYHLLHKKYSSKELCMINKAYFYAAGLFLTTLSYAGNLNFNLNNKASHSIVDNTDVSSSLPSPVSTDESDAAYKQYVCVYGDFLYWQPVISDTYWGVKELSSNSATEYFFGFDWDVGFRVGIQGTFNWEDLVFDLNWTRFHTTSTTTHQDSSLFSAPYGAYPRYSLYQLPYNNFSYGNPWKITASYNVKFDQIDFTASKLLFFGKRFCVAPMGGVRGLIVDYALDTHRYSTNYGLPLSTPDGPQDSSNISVRDKMRSIGLLAGLNTKFNLGCGFGFLFGGDFYIGYGPDKDISFSSNQTFAGAVEASHSYTTSTHKIRTMFDIMTGFDWNKNFLDNHLGLLLAVGYEFHYLEGSPVYVYPMANVEDYLEPSKYTAFQGLIVRAGLSF